LIDRRRLAVSITFLAFGIAGGSVIPRVPYFKEHLHLTDGQVGIAFLGFSIGGITGALVARLLIGRDARLSTRLCVLGLCAALAGPGLAQSFGQLIASFYVIGCFWGVLDVLANALGAQLENTTGRPLINGFHGFWSLGAVVGSLIAAAAAFLNVGPLTQGVIVGLVLAASTAWFLSGLPAYDRAPAAGVGRAVVTGGVVAVAAMCFTGIIAEGGTSDWSPLFLRELSRASPAVAASGITFFSLAAMLVRFRADRLTARTSPETVARLGAIIAAGGLVLAITSPALPTALAGFTLVGVGTAVVLPLAFAAGANLGSSGTPLALVMASTYAGTIAGPPAIGAAADHVGLRLAMAIPLLAAAAVLLLGGSLRRAQASPQTNRITASIPR
jgi:fucose permease